MTPAERRAHLQGKLSALGEKLAFGSGIEELMDDLGRAMSGSGTMLMLGGGNPAAIPEVQAIWREEMQTLLRQSTAFDRMLVNYDTPRGNPRFLAALAALFRHEFNWPIGPENVAVTNSSQIAHFMLFNLIAGPTAAGRQRKILLPLVPEYIGYADQGLTPDMFTARRPVLTPLGDHTFKYHIDFHQLTVTADIAGICISRPTNPTGNVISDTELLGLKALAAEHRVPLIVDNAYGAPFPNILFTEVTPYWDKDVIFTLSLSKLGLPGARTGIVIADEPWIDALVSMNAVMSLANGNVGQALVAPLLEKGRMLHVSRELVRPFYQEKRDLALAWTRDYFDASLPYAIHACEGALFLWLWCRDLPIGCREFYERLKARHVLVVPGSYFFYGLDEPWPHADECIRINYSQPESVVREGLKIIGEEMRRAYGQ